MTYNPADLVTIRDWLKPRTGLTNFTLGIMGDDEHAEGGGYHIGNDGLAGIGRLASDYSKRESPRDRPGTNAASALDVGRFTRTPNGHPITNRSLAAMMVSGLRAGDRRLRDVRELIYTLDGVTVPRWDRLGIRRTGGKNHIGPSEHFHVSFFRDSEGRRHHDDNFLGWLKDAFREPKPQPQPQPLEDDMTPEQAEHLKAMDNRIRDALVKGVETMRDIPGEGPAVPVWIVRTLNAHGLLLARLAGSVQDLTGKDLVDEQAVVEGVLAGLGTKPIEQIAAALKAAGVDTAALRAALDD